MIDDWSSGEVTANGIKLNYWRTGGDGPSILLAHGFTDNALCWTRVARTLQDTYDVVMVDARGHGRSSAPQKGYAYTEHADDLVRVIETLGLDQPTLMGHSMGADVLAVLAAQHPEHARCLILEDPPWFLLGMLPAPEIQSAMARQWQASNQQKKQMSIAAIIEAGKKEHPSWSEDEWGPWAESKRQVSPLAFREFGAPERPWQDVVRDIECPILLLTADPTHGGLVTAEAAAEAERLWRRGRVAQIPGAGHSIRRDNFRAYMDQVEAFLANPDMLGP